MADPDDGGPAFPRPAADGHNMAESGGGEQEGMALRDWFAGQAMSAWYGSDGGGMLPHPSNLSTHAEHFYAIADAMLKARSTSKAHDDPALRAVVALLAKWESQTEAIAINECEGSPAYAMHVGSIEELRAALRGGQLK